MIGQLWIQTASNTIFLSMVAGIPIFGALKKVNVYDSFVEGAKEGWQVVVRIIPYLVAMIVAVGMFRASGALDAIAHWLAPVLSYCGIPVDLLPMMLIRPFSGGAATGLMADIISTNGGDAYVSQLAATMMGATETTFYVFAVYFGSVGIRNTRHAMPAGLIADIVGFIAAVVVCRWLLL